MKSNFKILSLQILVLVTMISGLLGCKGKNKPLDERPTRGDISISVDESYKLLIDAEIYVFSTFYHYAKITPDYKPEWDVISDFINDSVKVIVTSNKAFEQWGEIFVDDVVAAAIMDRLLHHSYPFLFKGRVFV